MLRSFCINVVKASALIVCIGVLGSACVVRERTVVHDRHEDRHERHEERHER